MVSGVSILNFNLLTWDVTLSFGRGRGQYEQDLQHDNLQLKSLLSVLVLKGSGPTAFPVT